MSLTLATVATRVLDAMQQQAHRDHASANAGASRASASGLLGRAHLFGGPVVLSALSTAGNLVISRAGGIGSLRNGLALQGSLLLLVPGCGPPT